MTGLVAALVSTLVIGVASLRWLRVAQREHYLPGSVTVFAWRWTRIDPVNSVAYGAAIAATALVIGGVISFFVGAALVWLIALATPRGLGIRGASSPLRWTDRLRRLAGTSAILWLILAAIGALFPSFSLVAVLVFPIVVDAALGIMAPIERRLGRRWVDKAAATVARVGPRVVAITGSYGKTTTKEYVRQLLAGRTNVLASPASFNNRMGLARTVNEHLTDGVSVFVAEMGTYGKGEIAQLCEWIPPDISVITAIGPVHLERFGSLDNTLAAKAEILGRAETAVLNIDDLRLSQLADTLGGMAVVTVSASGATATVSLAPVEGGFDVVVHGSHVARIGPVAFPTNFACAIGVATALDAMPDDLTAIVETIELPQHRQTQHVAESGVVIIDDTYNSNPAGAAAALEKIGAFEARRKAVVTPGMVELGPEQHAANAEFGAAAAAVVDHVLIVGRTNRAALVEGTSKGPASVMLVRSRDDAVAWVKENLAAGDVVLYENDLPDHYP